MGSNGLNMAFLTRKRERAKSRKGKDFGGGLVNTFGVWAIRHEKGPQRRENIWHVFFGRNETLMITNLRSLKYEELGTTKDTKHTK